MKNISAPLLAHLQEELTTLALLVKVTRSDAVVLGFTTHDQDITYDGVVYKSDGILADKPLDSASGSKAKGFEIAGILDGEGIAESDLALGLYDNAEVEAYLCDWKNLSAGAVRMRRGWLGEVAMADGGYRAELRGMHDLLQRRIGETYTPECRYDLGDGRCGVALNALKVTGSVTAATDRSNFADSGRGEPDGYFAYGKLTWTSGVNAGTSVEVRDWSQADRAFSLWLPTPFAIAVGDGYEVAPGCDKRFSTCGGKFSNSVNFGGFPYLPGVGKILRYP